jgi:DNA-binding transcriptional ArsR family regulator
MVKSRVDRTFAALSDPTRRDILERLSRGPASISELARPYGMSLPGVMKHVRILEGADLVRSEKKGADPRMPARPRPAHGGDALDRVVPDAMGTAARPLAEVHRDREGSGEVTYDLTIERLIDAPPQVVFDSFVDPAAQKVLYGNEEEPDWTVQSELDLRVGGTWTIVFGSEGRSPFARRTSSPRSTGHTASYTTRRCSRESTGEASTRP